MSGSIDYEMAYRKVEERNARLEEENSILDEMIKAHEPGVSKEDYDALIARMDERVTELLEANERITMRAREAESKLEWMEREKRLTDRINRFLQAELMEAKRHLHDRWPGGVP